jgi:hypothetical protein
VCVAINTILMSIQYFLTATTYFDYFGSDVVTPENDRKGRNMQWLLIKILDTNYGSVDGHKSKTCKELLLI